MKKENRIKPWLNPEINGHKYIHIKDLSGGHQANTYIGRYNNIDYVIKHYYNPHPELIQPNLERAKREIKILESFSAQACFPQYIESRIEEDGKNIYIVMSYVVGLRLRDFLEKNDPDINIRLDKYKKILAAVGIFHERGYYHRDLKPDNILIKDDGQVVIVDFGLSINENTNEHIISLLGSRLGPLFFQCPESEVVSSESEFEKIGARFDLYPLGKLLYYLIKHNKDNHGYFPREKSAQSPWRLTGNEYLFQPVIASVVSETPESASVKNINELKKIFDKYYDLYMQDQNNDGSLRDDLQTMILKDANVHDKLAADAKEKILIENYRLIINFIQRIIQQKLTRINREVFTVSNNGSSAIDHSLPYDVSLGVNFQIKYLNDNDLGLSIILAKNKYNPKHNICLKIYFLINCFDREIVKKDQNNSRNYFDQKKERVVWDPIPYNKELNITNSTTLLKEDIRTDIESWTIGLDSFIENLIKENYQKWKELYEKNLQKSNRFSQ